jgi:hypothetical protein
VPQKEWKSFKGALKANRRFLGVNKLHVRSQSFLNYFAVSYAIERRSSDSIWSLMGI